MPAPMPAPSLSFTLAEIASRVGGELIGAGSGERLIIGLQTVQEAGEGDLTFIGDEHHAKAWATSGATAAVVSRSLAETVTGQCDPNDRRGVILVKNADNAMITVLELFAPAPELPPIGIHPTAIIAADARIGSNARIGPNVTVGRNARIGNDVSLFAGVAIYPDVVIGDACVLHAHVVIRERCVLGRRVILHGGVQIGTDGFGYRPSPDGRGILKVPHLGHVVLGDDVEIGANSCVDRGKFGATTIGMGTKIDNLVQIGHNCKIGRCVVISGLAGIAGSTTVGDGAMIGGGAGIADHLTLGSRVQVAARSAVMNDIPDGETWAGYPAKERRRAMQEVIVAAKMPEYIRNLRSVITETLGPEAAKLLDRSSEKPSTARDPKKSAESLPTSTSTASPKAPPINAPRES
jgi:UDP-3-O-[3-hydroxymyristoyl] glucosamine N-acyltransferase